MIEGLEALERIGKCDLHSEREDYCYIKNVYVNEYNIIEKALKEYEDLQKVLDDFGIYNTMNLIDTLKNIQFLEKRNAINSKELKALEIIKEKKVDVDLFLKSIDREMYNMVFESWNRPKDFQLTQEEYDLLKEVLV